jgi:hypothetical protein
MSHRRVAKRTASFLGFVIMFHSDDYISLFMSFAQRSDERRQSVPVGSVGQ